MYCKLISVIQKATEDNVTCNSAIYCFNCQSRRNRRRTKMIPCGSWSPKMAPNKPPFPVFTPLCSLNEHALALLLALTDRMEQKCCYASSKPLEKSDSFCSCSFGRSEPPCKKSGFPARETTWRGIVEKEKF